MFPKSLTTYHDPLLKPAAVRGEQVKPQATLGPTTTPTRPTIKSRTSELALVTESPIKTLGQQSRLEWIRRGSQHWIDPPLQELLMPEEPEG